MIRGVFQGLASSELFYSTAKCQVTQNTINTTKIQTNDKFQAFIIIDYVDDGKRTTTVTVTLNFRIFDPHPPSVTQCNGWKIYLW